METLPAPFSVSISELKRNPGTLIQKADGNPLTILNRNKPAACLVPAATCEALLEKLEDHELGQSSLSAGLRGIRLSRSSLMTYNLKFLPIALKQWKKPDSWRSWLLSPHVSAKGADLDNPETSWP